MLQSLQGSPKKKKIIVLDNYGSLYISLSCQVLSTSILRYLPLYFSLLSFFSSALLNRKVVTNRHVRSVHAYTHILAHVQTHTHVSTSLQNLPSSPRHTVCLLLPQSTMSLSRRALMRLSHNSDGSIHCISSL